MQIKDIKQWFEIAVPNPTIENVSVQYGCHLEEVAEMLEVTDWGSMALSKLLSLAEAYKDNNPHCSELLTKLDNNQKIELLDSLCDQIVTAVGVAHMLGMDIEGALKEVNDSNMSKFEDGKAVFNENGKIKKGKHYRKPNLTSFINSKE